MKNKLLIGFVLLIALGGIIALSVERSDDTNTTTSIDIIHVATVINDGASQQTYSSEVATGTTALDVLLSVAQANTFEVQTTVYDFGSMVDSINGVGSETSSNKFWIYYINDASATVGASSYAVVDGDTILWKFEEAKM